MTGTPNPPAADLRAVPLFDDCDQGSLDQAAAALVAVRVPAGARLMHESNDGHELVIVQRGSLAVSRRDRDDGPVAVIGDGGFVGELSLLHRTPRSATVVALTPSHLLVCAERHFDLLLQLPGVAAKLAATGEHREAINRAAGVVPVNVELRDASSVALRPILPTDANAMRAGLDRLSATSRYRRFLSTNVPTESMITALADIDYPEHFAWVVVDHAGDGDPIATGRFVRTANKHRTAEIALTVADDHQGRGIGAVLLDALAIAADEAGFTHFNAFVLRENAPMRELLRRRGAHLVADEDFGTLEATFAIPGRSLTLRTEEQIGLRDAVRHVLGNAHRAA